MQQLNDTMLHLLTRHTNLTLPYSDYIRSAEFPEQISELINTYVTVKYRDYYTYSNDSKEKAALITRNGEQISSRPLDDAQQLKRVPVSGPDALEENDIYTGSFRVLRADKAEPYVFIGLTDDGKFMITGSTKIEESGEYNFLSHVAEYPYQINVLLGMAFNDQYAADLTRLKSTPLRVDEGEPCMSVLMEYVDDSTVRFVLGDECISILQTASSDRSKLVEYYKKVEEAQAEATEEESAQITKDLAEEQMGIYPDDGEFNFGDIDEGDETAVGDYEFGDLDETNNDEPAMTEGDYDFDVFAITNVKINRVDTSTDNPGEEPVDPEDVEVPITPLLNDFQIAEFRKNILEGKTIYGAL